MTIWNAKGNRRIPSSVAKRSIREATALWVHSVGVYSHEGELDIVDHSAFRHIDLVGVEVDPDSGKARVPQDLTATI